MKYFLQNLKSRKYIGVSELGVQVAEILEQSKTLQGKATVTEYPDERTVRYYIAENLIPPSMEKQGTSSVFGYEHLLALLAVKKLQSQNLPIKKIREILAGKSPSELERLLDVDAVAEDAKNEAQEFLESLLLQNRKQTDETPKKSLLLRAVPPKSSPKANISQSPQRWLRFEIAKGLELHIEKNFKAPSDSRERRTFIKVIEEIIQSLGNK